MLDRDLAELYGIKTKALNQAVKRNPGRFPEDFMFLLSREEILRMSQFVTSSWGQNLRFSKSVSVFTEQGVAMLSSVLKSERAIQVNILIMRTFVKIKQFLATHKELADKLKKLEQRMDKYDDKIIAILNAIKQLVEPTPEENRKIGFLRD